MAHQASELSFIFIVLFVLQLILLIGINLITKRKLLRNVRIIMASSYIVIIMNLTIWPIVGNQPPVSWSEIPYNLVPFNSMLEALDHFYYAVPLRNIIGNIILLLPLAFILRLNGLRMALFTGLIISLMIETAQLLLTKAGYIHRRAFDVDDLILNAVGFLIGYSLRVRYRSWIAAYKKIKHNAEQTNGGRHD